MQHPFVLRAARKRKGAHNATCTMEQAVHDVPGTSVEAVARAHGSATTLPTAAQASVRVCVRQSHSPSPDRALRCQPVVTARPARSGRPTMHDAQRRVRACTMNSEYTNAIAATLSSVAAGGASCQSGTCGCYAADLDDPACPFGLRTGGRRRAHQREQLRLNSVRAVGEIVKCETSNARAYFGKRAPTNRPKALVRQAAEDDHGCHSPIVGQPAQSPHAQRGTGTPQRAGWLTKLQVHRTHANGGIAPAAWRSDYRPRN